MATTVHGEETVTLMDGTTIKVRPLKVSLLRPFMVTFEKVAAVAEDNAKSMDLLIECVVIAMKQYDEKLASKEILEEVLDLPTVYKIIEAASGVKLTDATTLLNAITANN